MFHVFLMEGQNQFQLPMAPPLINQLADKIKYSFWPVTDVVNFLPELDSYIAIFSGIISYKHSYQPLSCYFSVITLLMSHILFEVFSTVRNCMGQVLQLRMFM